MGLMSLDSRQVFSEFIGFLAGEGLLWQVIDYAAREHGYTLQGTDHDHLIWFRAFLLTLSSEFSYSNYDGLLAWLFSWGNSIGGYAYWKSVQLKWSSSFRMLYPLELFAVRSV